MEIKDARIDGGNPFDWGRTAADYARYRDIYPPEFYRAILDRGVGLAGQQVLDIGTGTGVLPRHLYKHGAHWLGVDPSPQQIAEARRLSTGMNIDYRVCAAEGELSATVQENLTGVRVVRAFGREKYEVERFDKKNERFASLWIRLGRLGSLPSFFLRGARCCCW